VFWIYKITFPLTILAIFIQMSFIQICTLFHMNPYHFEKCILLMFHNITLCSSHPNMNKAKIMWLDENKIPITIPVCIRQPYNLIRFKSYKIKLSLVFPFLLIVVGWLNTLTTLFIFPSFGFALLTWIGVSKVPNGKEF